jgi:peptidyl-prolyl cis-trans isomerase SurA
MPWGSLTIPLNFVDSSKNPMRTSVFFAFACTLFSASSFAQGDHPMGHESTTTFTTIDAIVAVVGDGIVLESEVEAQAFAMKAQMAQMGKNTDLSDAQRCNLLEELLFQKLLVHHAKLDSLEVSEGEVMDEIDRRLAYYIQMFGSVEAFEAEYGQSVSEWKAEFEDPVREQLLAGRMQASINQQVRATPAEVQLLFAETPADSLPLIPEALRYRELVLQPDITEGQKAEVRNFLDSVRTQVATGKLSMTLAASRYSEDPGSKYKGGCYQNIGRGQFVPEFEATVFDTPIGDLSPVFETDFGYHFLRVTDRRGQVFSACHVLVSPKVDPLALAEMGTEMDSIAAQINSGDLEFADAVLRYSTREVTKNQGGVVVNPRDGGTLFGSDEIDPNLFFLLNTLEPNAVSEPIQLTDEDDQGYWIAVQLMERVAAHRANPTQDFGYFQTIVEDGLRSEQLDGWILDAIQDTYIRVDAPYTQCAFDQNWTAGSSTGAVD